MLAQQAGCRHGPTLSHSPVPPVLLGLSVQQILSEHLCGHLAQSCFSSLPPASVHPPAVLHLPANTHPGVSLPAPHFCTGRERGKKRFEMVATVCLNCPLARAEQIIHSPTLCQADRYTDWFSIQREVTAIQVLLLMLRLLLRGRVMN